MSDPIPHRDWSIRVHRSGVKQRGTAFLAGVRAPGSASWLTVIGRYPNRGAAIDAAKAFIDIQVDRPERLVKTRMTNRSLWWEKEAAQRRAKSAAIAANTGDPS